MFKLTVRESNDAAAKSKQFAVGYASLARYYTTHFESGVDNIQLILDGANEVELAAGNGHLVNIQRAKFIYWFRDGTQVSCKDGLDR